MTGLRYISAVSNATGLETNGRRRRWHFRGPGGVVTAGRVKVINRTAVPRFPAIATRRLTRTQRVLRTSVEYIFFHRPFDTVGAVGVPHYKSKSIYSITERRVPELIPVLGSQLAVTPVTLKRAATSFAAW